MIRPEHKQFFSIDTLKSYGVDPQYFGLGFIQLKITDDTRLHFYHDDLPVLAEEPHDHRYGFTSYVLKGKFIQEFYSFCPDKKGVWEKVNVSCDPANPSPDDRIVGTLETLATCEFNPGDAYDINSSTLHTVAGKNNAITYLCRNAIEKEFPYIVRLIGAASVCPFSKPISVPKCWDMIEDMITEPEQPGLLNPGYHITEIPKGEIGEPSKIVEEALEIEDAHRQGVKIMTQVEMSDLYGALDRFREKYHPDLSMCDIESMYRVTRRAFDNGRR